MFCQKKKEDLRHFKNEKQTSYNSADSKSDGISPKQPEQSVCQHWKLKEQADEPPHVHADLCVWILIRNVRIKTDACAAWECARSEVLHLKGQFEREEKKKKKKTCTF